MKRGRKKWNISVVFKTRLQTCKICHLLMDFIFLQVLYKYFSKLISLCCFACSCFNNANDGVEKAIFVVLQTYMQLDLVVLTPVVHSQFIFWKFCTNQAMVITIPEMPGQLSIILSCITEIWHHLVKVEIFIYSKNYHLNSTFEGMYFGKFGSGVSWIATKIPTAFKSA